MTNETLTPGAAGVPATPGGARRKARRKEYVAGGKPLWLMAPTLVLLVLVIGVPFVIGAYISFFELDQYNLRTWVSAPFIGLKNYADSLGAALLLHSIWVSLAFAVLTTLFSAPIGFLAALAVNTRFRGRGVVRSLFLVPYVLPSFVTATVWRFILRPDGVFNKVFGLHNVQWLIGSNSFWALVLVDIWAAWPFVYMMTLAGLQAIPDELYEAADVDGVTWFKKIVYMVIPQIRHQLLLGLLLSTLNHFNNFTLPFVLFGTPAPNDVLTLQVNIYQTSFQYFRFGLGGAMSVLSLILTLIPAFIYLRASRLTAAPGEE